MIHGNKLSIYLSIYYLLVDWEFRITAKNKLVWRESRRRMLRTVVRVYHRRQVVLPVLLFVWLQSAKHLQQRPVETLDNSVAHSMIWRCSGLADAHDLVKLLYHTGLERTSLVTVESGGSAKKDPGRGFCRLIPIRIRLWEFRKMIRDDQNILTALRWFNGDSL